MKPGKLYNTTTILIITSGGQTIVKDLDVDISFVFSPNHEKINHKKQDIFKLFSRLTITQLELKTGVFPQTFNFYVKQSGLPYDYQFGNPADGTRFGEYLMIRIGRFRSEYRQSKQCHDNKLDTIEEQIVETNMPIDNPTVDPNAILLTAFKTISAGRNYSKKNVFGRYLCTIDCYVTKYSKKESRKAVIEILSGKANIELFTIAFSNPSFFIKDDYYKTTFRLMYDMVKPDDHELTQAFKLVVGYMMKQAMLTEQMQ